MTDGTTERMMALRLNLSLSGVFLSFTMALNFFSSTSGGTIASTS